METLVISKECIEQGSGNAKNGECPKKKNGRTPRRRSGKKDRHSKIVTAQGTRDRRMRLSLEIARKFFNLQDMLGFDIASKTVEWLLKQSDQAIQELSKSCTSKSNNEASSSISECGEASKIDLSVPKSMMARSSRDLRVQARARARVRTLEKMRMDKPKQRFIQVGPRHSNSIPVVFDQSRGNVRPSTEVSAQFSHSPQDQGPNGDIVSKYFLVNTASKPSAGVASNNTTNLPNIQGIWTDDIAKMPTNCYANRVLGNVQDPISSSIFLISSDIHLQSQFVNTNQFY